MLSNHISRRLAQQIVDTVKDTCTYDANYISPDGIIYASTDAKRVGTYHEIGHTVAKEGTAIEVTEENVFYGTHCGVNLPFTYHGKLIAVIGITGAPEKVRRYAYLAQRITTLILREQELEAKAHTERTHTRYIAQSLLHGPLPAHEFLVAYIQKNGLSLTEPYRCLLIELNHHYNPANLSMIEQRVYAAFKQTGTVFYLAEYPNHYILLSEESRYQTWHRALKKLAQENKGIIRLAIGTPHQLEQVRQSYEEALIVLQSLPAALAVGRYETLTLELLIGSLSESQRRCYLTNTVANLREKERRYLMAYFEHNLSLQGAAASLFIHKNTLTYHLQKIKNATGYDPHRFKDAVALYLDCKIAADRKRQ